MRTTEYAYHDGSTSNGVAGELKTAVLKDAAGNVLDESYYRYYTSGSSSGLMKSAFGPEAFVRVATALGTGFDSFTDTQVAPYADKYLEYDSSGRITKAGEGAVARPRLAASRFLVGKTALRGGRVGDCG